MDQDKVSDLKRIAHEKGYTVDLRQEVINLIPRNPKQASASFPIDEVEMAIEWLKLWM